MHPAEELQLAAKQLRERASAATPGPWQHMCLGSEGCLVLRKKRTIREHGHNRVARFGQKDWQADHADAEYVAGMHPGVALALADWLDGEAAVIGGFRDPDPLPLAVARAYLGTDDDSNEEG
jgi:hypothetical protein